ncbi:MAG: hypothetical protein ACON4R_00570 [Akkermansiaceae bacterium]
MKFIIPLLISPILLISCAQRSLTGDTYLRSEAGKIQSVNSGQITSLRNVKIEGDTSGGAFLGSVAGGLLGNEVGSGAGRTAATIGASLLGGAIGAQTQKAIGSRQGVEIQVKLDTGKTVSIVQEANPREPFAVGERVRVLAGSGGSKVTH